MSRRVVMGLSLMLSLGVLALLVVGLGGSVDAFGGLTWSSAQAPGSATPVPTPRAAAGNVQAFYQGDPTAGWDSSAQYTLWWPSACSPAALTMALRAWGAPVSIGQVLDRLIDLNAITPQDGLLHAQALATVAEGYGFQGTTFWSWTLQDVAHVTGQGVPVLIDVVDAKQQTPYPGFSVGHWLVVTGVASNQVLVSDSSGYHIHSLSLALFHTLFTGIGVAVWQGAAISLP
jgi:hypothetical protein